MTRQHIQHLFAALLLGNIACGSDAAHKSTGSSKAAQNADDDTDDEADPKPAARDAGTRKKDAGKPAKDDTDQDQASDDDAVADQGPARVIDAGKKPAAAVDAGHAEHVASSAADAGSVPVASEATVAAAKTFCGKYEMYCGYGKMNRHADEKACLADFEGNPLQQGCKIMHLDTSIAGTAAACNGMQSAFCFSIHCLHATGITDPTGVTYCK
jgi:hypothetical protein